MELLTEKEAILIQECIQFVIEASKHGHAKFNETTYIEDLEDLLKKLRGER